MKKENVERKIMESRQNLKAAVKGTEPVFACRAFWDSDRVCRNCTHYGYGGYCDIDDKKYSPNYYCSSFREI